MAVITPPKYVITLLERLGQNGFEAYMVGGCVRDALMGRRPNDWDICTSALPEQVRRIFPRTHPTGIKHGTVTVVSAGHPLEVTTYRTDGDYLGHRRPRSVCFVSDLKEDLRRRDFTINAMALSLDGELCDPFGGQSDIEKKLIRCVGSPQERFNEDALRMLRAVRFSAVLGFETEPCALDAIKRLSPLTAELAAERISTELMKTLMSPRPEKVEEMLKLGLLRKVLDCTCDVDLSPLGMLPKAPQGRLSGFCAILHRDGIITDCYGLLRALRLESAVIKSVSSGVSAALSGAPESAADWKRLSARIGDEGCFCCAAALEALEGRRVLSRWRRVLKSGECRSLGELAVSGGDLISLGLRGAEVGETLLWLLDYVAENPHENRQETLLTLATQRQKK